MWYFIYININVCNNIAREKCSYMLYSLYRGQMASLLSRFIRPWEGTTNSVGSPHGHLNKVFFIHDYIAFIFLEWK